MNKELSFLMQIAENAAVRSTAQRSKVGAVIADANLNFISYGYNGSIRGGDNVLEYKQYTSNSMARFKDENGYYDLVTKPSTIHAEKNCLAHAARRGISTDGGICVVTLSPCAACSAMLYQSGIRVIYFKEQYRLFDQVEEELGKYISFRHFQG